MEYRTPESLKKLLDHLQQESWQLELIISGFVIFLLIGLREPLNGLWADSLTIALGSSSFKELLLPVLIFYGAWFTLMINLLIHLILRGLWISTIGLRYVSQDINFEELNLHPLFDRFLRNKIKSFDLYIERLERICSVMFAFAFLVVFMLLSLCLFFLTITLIDRLLLNWLSDQLGTVGKVIEEVVSVGFIIGGLLYFIDFLTLSRLKKVKWMARFYFPVYRFFSWITLANLYRPIYYNLIDNRFGRRVGWLLVPFILAALIFSSIRFRYQPFLPDLEPGHTVDKTYYEDLLDDDRFGFYPTIPSRYIENGFLEVFLPYHARLDDLALKKVCPDLQPAKKEAIILKGYLNLDLAKKLDYDTEAILQCFDQIHRLSVNDSLVRSPEYLIYNHPKRGMNGLLVVLDLNDLARGRHELTIQKFGLDPAQPMAGLVWQNAIRIPFWKE